MKSMKKVFLIPALIILASCADLEVENTLAPDAGRALANPSDLISLVGGAAGDVFYDQHGVAGTVHYDLQSDILTATNNAYGFWHVCDQPRREIVNNTGYSEYFYIQDTWDYNITAITNLTSVIKAVKSGVVLTDENDVDVTAKVLAMAYFVRGVAHGTIAMVYDQGYAINEDTDLITLELTDYKTVMAEAISSLEQAIDIIDSEGVASVDFYPQSGVTFTGAEFKQLCSSYAARYMLGVARNSTEAASLNYATIKAYAEAGITEDFTVVTDGSVLAPEDLNFIQYRIAADAAYIPVDQMIAHLFDPNNQPADYPTGSTVLPKPVTDDARLDLYYEYSTNFGFLNASRNRLLFSNLQLSRYPENINPPSYAGTRVPFMLASEMDYIIAECEWQLGNNSTALGIINGSARSTIGELPAANDASDAGILNLLHYEHAIELAHTGKAINWGFMRRHDMLQTGTPLHWAVPARELEILGLPLYTYGSSARADGVNTADGSNSWNGN